MGQLIKSAFGYRHAGHAEACGSIYHVAPREGVQSLAQRYAEGRKGMGLKIGGYAADSILQVFFAKKLIRSAA
jgi:hypothetical protein